MQTSPKTITAQEQSQLLAKLLKTNASQSVKQRGVRNYTIALMMLDAGLRVSEVTSLRVVDLTFNQLPIKSIIITPQNSKNNLARNIPLSQRLQAAIELMNQYIWSIFSFTPDHFAFAMSRKSKPPSTRQIQRTIKQTSLDAFGRAITPHVLRHTFATRMMRVTNIRTVQALLGHVSLSSTQIYTHPNGDDLTKAIDALG